MRLLNTFGTSSGISESSAGGSEFAVDLPVGFAIAHLLSKETVGGWAASITERSSARMDDGRTGTGWRVAPGMKRLPPAELIHLEAHGQDHHLSAVRHPRGGGL
jgi:hypothetical protein